MNLPPIGFGCSPYRPGSRHVDLESAVRSAVAAGYRMFDVAELYGNERAVGRSLRQAPAKSELHVIGKVWRTNFRPAALRQACEASLLRLGVDAFSLYLLHAPEAWQHAGALADAEEMGWDELARRALPRDSEGNPLTDDVPLRETWEAMQDLARRGLTARIGVSNFEPAQIEALGAVPAANQIACSPYRPNAQTAAWCRGKGILVMAHSPLSQPGLLSEPVLQRLAARVGCSPAQVVLRWSHQSGLLPLPSSTNPAHILENVQALDFELDAAMMSALDELRYPPEP